MTAARPSSANAPALPFDRTGWPARTLAAVLCLTTAWVPWALVWGDAISDLGRAAQAEGRALADGVRLPEVAGDTLILFPGTASPTPIGFDALFSGASSGNVANFTELYGNDPAVRAAGLGAQADLLGEDSATARAYQTLRAPVHRARPDLRNDPIWRQTDEVLDDFPALAATFADCAWESEFSSSERLTHVPDIQGCERVMDYSGACEITHDYRIEEIFNAGILRRGLRALDRGPALSHRSLLPVARRHAHGAETCGDPKRDPGGGLVRGLHRGALDRWAQSLCAHRRELREQRFADRVARA